MKLKPEIKKSWLAALRSGEFTQGTQYLCTVDNESNKKRFCCLGVLSELQNIKPKPARTGDNEHYWHRMPVGDYDILEYEFPDIEWVPLISVSLPSAAWFSTLLELPEQAGQLNVIKLLGNIAEMNDNGWPFKEIADWIEENL